MNLTNDRKSLVDAQPSVKTLRDEFAMAAIAGWLASFGSDKAHPAHTGTADSCAREAYQMADAMLAARDLAK